MSCIILRPDPQVLFDQIRSAFSSTVLGGGQIIPESNEWYVVSNDYAMSEMFFAVADQMWRERNPETACCDNLFKMAARNGVFPRPASHAEGYAKLTGVVGSAIPPALEISAGASTYTSVGTIPLTIPSLAPGDTQGVAIVRVRALTPGPDANAHSDVPTGTLVTVAPGIDPEVVICGASFCGGAAAEACEDFRKRYLDRLAYHPKATMAWLQQKILEFPCVTRVCVREGACCRCEAECGDCSCKNCGNRMELYALFENAFPCGIPPANVVEDLNTWVFGEHQGYGEGQVEIGVCGRIYAPWPLLVNVLIDIAGCPTVSQKQLIEDQVRALFRRICPSIPLLNKQIELIVASVIGVEINAAARFEIVDHPGEENWVYVGNAGAFLNHCGLEPICDTLPCLADVTFTNQDQQRPNCG